MRILFIIQLFLVVGIQSGYCHNNKSYFTRSEWKEIKRVFNRNHFYNLRQNETAKKTRRLLAEFRKLAVKDHQSIVGNRKFLPKLGRVDGSASENLTYIVNKYGNR
ncbi:MAG: hypothetical protein HOE90_15005 [Bacteriovoracaceae bacterium]|jgi:hypothetical protein|nr:hypothetical protein [Bacteriovoracaceae bacterium]